MSKIPASVGILTFNSAATLRRALESVKEFDDIVLCDGGSTDETLSIAQEFGARVVAQDAQYKKADGTLKNFSGVRNQMLEAAVHDWFLYIDSDETISDGLREEIRRASSKTDGGPLAYRVPIGILIDGRYIKHSSNYPGYQFRFFNKRSGAHFIKPVHERIELPVDTPLSTFKHPWYVHSTRADWENYFENNARYRHMEAARAAREPWSLLLPGIFWQLRAALSVFLKTLWIRLRWGSRDSIPLRGEWGRMLTPLYLVAEALYLRVARPTNGSRYSLK